MTFPSRILGPAAVALIAAMLIGCNDVEDRPAVMADQETDDRFTEDDLRGFLPPNVDHVNINIDGCPAPPGDAVTLEVDPSVAYINPRADNFEWRINGGRAARVGVQPKAGETNWPFADSLPPWTPANPGPIRPGTPPSGQHGDSSSYDVVVQCGATRIIIDPDIIIRDPDMLRSF